MSNEWTLDEYSTGEWLKGNDISEPQILTIMNTYLHEFDDGNKKPVLEFGEIPTKMRLNVTQVRTLKELFPEVEDGEGLVARRIMVLKSPTQFQGNHSIAIAKAPSPKKKKKRMVEVEVEEEEEGNIEFGE